MPPFPALAAPLADGRVRLRPFGERDIPEILIAYQDDPSLHGQLEERRPPSAAELGRESERAQADRQAGRRLALTILEPGAEDCRGRIVIEDVDWEEGSGRLQVWVAPQFRGRGLARAAVKLASEWLFDECGMTRLALPGVTLTPAGKHA